MATSSVDWGLALGFGDWVRNEDGTLKALRN